MVFLVESLMAGCDVSAAKMLSIAAMSRIRVATTDVIAANAHLDVGLAVRKERRYYLPCAVRFSSAVEITITTPFR
jgi:hypothetical protein